MEDLPLMKHLDELRFRLVLVIVVLLFFFFIGIFFANPILAEINNDLLTNNVRLITITPLEFIYTQIKIAFFFSIVLTSPLLIYETLIFIKPALTNKEKRAIKFILPSFILLFLVGTFFAYFIFLKVAIYFLAKLSIGVTLNLWSIDKFVSFIFATSLSFGLIFQLPLFLLVLKKLNIVSMNFLRTKRRYIYVLVFLIAAIITPPDVVTQILIAVPLILLYEISLFVVRVFS